MKFNAKNLVAGLYSTSIKVNTNDGANQIVTIPCSLTVTSTGGKPIVQFAASKTSLSIGESTIFNDYSTNFPTYWRWTFQGGSPSSSLAQNPTVTYPIAGTFQVKLFARNSLGQDSLVKINYITVLNNNTLCNLSSSSSISGRLFDSGGPSGNYNNNENCSFLINSTCTGNLVIGFNSFATQLGTDYLKIYNGTNVSSPLILNTSGSTIPLPVYASSGKALVVFTSNSSTTGTGFDINWGCGVVNSLETENISESQFNIYPNPADSEINIVFKSEGSQPVTFAIVNALGTTITEWQSVDSISYKRTMELSNLPAGYYVLTALHNGKLLQRSFVLLK